MQTTNRGLVSIDILRGVAATGVFYYHQHIGTLIGRFTGLNWFGYTDDFGAEYAVALFFLLSGFCIHLPNIKYLKENKSLPLAAYLKRRFLRIYPPYLAALIFSIVVNYLILPAFTINTADLITHIFLFQGFSIKYFNTINLVLWTISVEFALYLLYPAFYYLRLKTSLKKALIAAFTISAISIATIQYFNLQTTVGFFFVLNLWFAWCCGAFIAECLTLAPGELKKPVYLILYGLIVAGFALLGKFSLIHYPFKILIWAGPMVLLLRAEGWLSQSRSLIIRLLTVLGLSSYSLYLFHLPLIELKNFTAHLLPPRLQMAGLMLGIFIIPVITWLCYQYIEKPFMRKKTATLK